MDIYVRFVNETCFRIIFGRREECEYVSLSACVCVCIVFEKCMHLTFVARNKTRYYGIPTKTFEYYVICSQSHSNACPTVHKCQLFSLSLSRTPNPAWNVCMCIQTLCTSTVASVERPIERERAWCGTSHHAMVQYINSSRCINIPSLTVILPH